jgi:hypothetical protein
LITGEQFLDHRPLRCFWNRKPAPMLKFQFRSSRGGGSRARDGGPFGRQPAARGRVAI